MGMTNKKKIVYILAITMSIIYLIWRLFFTIPWGATFLTLVFALLLVVSEIISSLTAYILIILRLIETRKKAKRKNNLPLFKSSQEVPAVDIIIVTHNEDVELLRKTINAATFIEYPEKEKVTIAVADDGNRVEVKKLAEEYNVKYIGLKNNKEAKSGNINNALTLLNAPLFVILDADMIPFSTFLMHSVPFFTENFEELKRNPDKTKPLGFVQTPQSFYNADIFQFNLFSEKVVANEQDFFSRDVNILNGSNDMAIFTGSNAVFLRKAVDEVGGFPTNTLTEDFQLGAEINIAGYRSIATITPESSGTTPVDVKGVIKQRTRWARGVMQSARNLHIFLNPKISFLNRVILINSYLYWWSFLRRLIYIVAPLLYAIFKIQVVNANFWILMVIWAPGYFLLHYVLGDASSNIRGERWGEIQETFFAPYLFIPVLLETFGIRQKKFKVTTKGIKTSFIDKLYVLPYFILWALTLFAIIKFNYGKWGSEIIVGSVITFWLVMHFINLSFCVFISLGRDIFRNSERFGRNISGKAYLKDEVYHDIVTEDISEGGFSFHFNENINKLHQGQSFRVILYHKKFPVHIDCRLVRVTEANDNTTYGVVITDIIGKDKNHYLQLVYDGENTLLPSEQDSWVTPLDELNLNLTMRLKHWDQKFHKYIYKRRGK